MSVLSDARILESIYDYKLIISPLVSEHIQPSSIDLTLDNNIKVPKNGAATISILEESYEQYFEDQKIEDYVLSPGDFIIAQIRETIVLSKDLTGTILNRNSLIRLGINVGLSTYINPGYRGQLPIVIQNIGKHGAKLVPGMRICQLVLHDVTPPAENDYSSKSDAKYQGEKGSLLSKLHLDIEILKAKQKGVADTAELIAFFEERLKTRSKNLIEELPEDKKKEFGLIK